MIVMMAMAVVLVLLHIEMDQNDKGNFKKIGKKGLGSEIGGQGWSGHQKHRYFSIWSTLW